MHSDNILKQVYVIGLEQLFWFDFDLEGTQAHLVGLVMLHHRHRNHNHLPRRHKTHRRLSVSSVQPIFQSVIKIILCNI